MIVTKRSLKRRVYELETQLRRAETELALMEREYMQERRFSDHLYESLVGAQKALGRGDFRGGHATPSSQPSPSSKPRGPVLG